MSAIVELHVVKGPLQGKQFAFDQHDTFVCGRADCHVQMPPEDKTSSRHHFLLETNPPEAVVRDLGSLNGTWVNGVKQGGRKKDELPEQAAQRRFPQVRLKDGDRVQVGETTLLVRVEVPALCCECERPIAAVDRNACAWIGGTFICPPCKKKLVAAANPAKPAPVRCQQCGKDVTSEIGQGCRGEYVCEACREKAKPDPAALLEQLLQKAKQSPGKTPEISGYKIEKKLGEGAFGAVYRAVRKRDDQRVAVKIMLAKVAVSADAREKFSREIEVMKDLLHRNIVAMLDRGSAGSAFYFIMEYCEGGSVADVMEQQGGKLPLVQAGPIMRDCLEGLAYAHAKGFVHRDLKPHNILLGGRDGNRVVKIGDFGMAKSFEQAGLSGMTVTGDYAGTPAFMPREQVINFRQVKPVTDVWSLGATFYCMLTGQIPRDFPRGVDPMEVVLGGKVIPIRERDAGVPRKLAAVIDRSLVVSPKERFQDATEFRKALEAAL